MAKKVNRNYLKRLVKQVIAEEKQARKPRKRTTRHKLRLAESLVKAKLLIEQDQPEAEAVPDDEDVPAEVSDAADAQGADQGDAPAGDAVGAVAGTSADTDINSMDPAAIADAMLSGVDNDLYTAILDSTDPKRWMPGKLASLGAEDSAGMKTLAVQVFGGGDEAAARSTIIQRVGEINSKLGASQGFEKAEMPALEGVDVDALEDALNSQTGELGVDASASYKDDEPGFEDWYAEQGETDEFRKEEEEDAEQAKGEKSGNTEVQAASHRRGGDVILERWAKLAGMTTLKEINKDDRFPFPGPASVMDGAPKLNPKGTVDTGAIQGKAKAFLTKGKGTDGDAFAINRNQPLTNSAMKPTQTNIKAGKSLGFALGDIGQNMEGAFATSNGDILDGHHRWSGQYLRTGGDVSMENVHLIDMGGMDMPEFLTMLTVVGNALGRPTKLK